MSVYQIMNYSGHKEESFNPKNKKSLRRIVRLIKDQIIKENKILYGALKGEELKKLLDKDSFKDEYQVEDILGDNDSFIMKEDTKLLVAPVPRGG